MGQSQRVIESQQWVNQSPLLPRTSEKMKKNAAQ
uniref:Uncharacterized protein n=1 Tax=Ralstonia syzygii R24 TaxID=907261 RepID=G3A0I8_9RALS|nr:hypothetical protein RALSY_10674 [Ralstonia syzygii R24]